MKRISRLLGKEKNVQFDDWVKRYEGELLRSGLISAACNVNRTTGLCSRSNIRSWVILVCFPICFIRHSINLYFSESAVSDTIFTALNGDTLKILGSASGVTHFMYIIGCLMSCCNRLAFIWAESKGLIVQLHDIRPEQIQALKLIVKVLDFLNIFSMPLCFVLVSSLSITANLQEKSVLFTLISPLHLASDLTTTYFFVNEIFLIPSFILISVISVSQKIKEVNFKLSSVLKNVSRTFIDNEIEDLYKNIRQHNHFMQYLLMNVMMFMGPFVSISVFLESSDAPAWFRLLYVAEFTPVIILLQASMSLCGHLFTDSRGLLGTLYSISAYSATENRKPVSQLIKLKRLIKAISSDRESFSFSLPDGSAFTPITSVSFASTTIANTFLFLSNVIILKLF